MDLPYHGDRIDSKYPLDNPKTMLKIFDQSLKDLKSLYKHYHTMNLIQDHKVALVGESLGGLITNIALCQYDWVSLAIPLMATPKINDFLLLEANKSIDNDFMKHGLKILLKTYKKYDLSFNPEKIKGRPVLMWNDFDDKVVPFEHAQDFYEEIKDQAYAENLKIVNTHGIGHRVSSKVRNIMVEFICDNL